MEKKVGKSWKITSCWWKIPGFYGVFGVLMFACPGVSTSVDGTGCPVDFHLVGWDSSEKIGGFRARMMKNVSLPSLGSEPCFLIFVKFVLCGVLVCTTPNPGLPAANGEFSGAPSLKVGTI